MASPMPASPHASSSLAIGIMSPPGSKKHWVMKSKEYRPIRAASSMIGHGVSSRSSHSWAAGRMTSSAKSWTHFWIWSWSSLRSSENSDMSSPWSKHRSGQASRSARLRPRPRRARVGGAASTYPLLLNGNLWAVASTTICAEDCHSRPHDQGEHQGNGQNHPALHEGGPDAEELVGEAARPPVRRCGPGPRALAGRRGPCRGRRPTRATTRALSAGVHKLWPGGHEQTEGAPGRHGLWTVGRAGARRPR